MLNDRAIRGADKVYVRPRLRTRLRIFIDLLARDSSNYPTSNKILNWHPNFYSYVITQKFNASFEDNIYYNKFTLKIESDSFGNLSFVTK